MAQSVISIKFDGYDKTFANINGIAEELSSMNEEILKAEKELANADFGSDEWNNLSESIVNNTKLMQDFTKEVVKTTNVTEDSLGRIQEAYKENEKAIVDANDAIVKSNQEYIKNLEEAQKVFDEEFSSAKITEFGAKASAALLGVAESVAVLGGSSKSAEELQKSFQQTVIVTNALKDSAEVLGDAQKKLSALTDAVSASFKSGATFSQRFSKGMDLLTKASRGPLLVFTLIIGSITAMTQVFGGLQETIDAVTDSFAGFIRAAKALFSGRFKDVFDEFDKGKQAAEDLRFLNNELNTLTRLTAQAADSWAKYQAAADQALTVEERGKNLNKIYEEKRELLESEVKALEQIYDIEQKRDGYTDEVRQRYIDLQTKKAELIAQESENIILNKDLTLEAIANEVQALDIRNSRVIDGLQKELEYAGLNLDARLEIIDKIGAAEQASIDENIKQLETKVKLNEAEKNTLEDLKNQSARIAEQTVANKRAEIIAVGQLLRSRIALENQLEIERSEKQLEFIDIRNEAGIEYFTAEVKRIEGLKTAAIDAELESLRVLEESGVLTEEQEQRRIELINERQNVIIESDEKIKEKQTESLDLYYEREKSYIEFNNELRAQFLEQQNIESEAYIRFLDRQKDLVIKQAESFGSIFRIGKLREQTEELINNKYKAQRKALEDNKNEQLKLIEAQKLSLALDAAKLKAKIDARTATSAEQDAYDKLIKQIEVLTGQENTVKLNFEVAVNENEIANEQEIKDNFSNIIDGVAEEVGKTAELAQTVVSIGGDIIGLQIEALDAELDKIEDKRKSIEDKLAILNKQLADTQQEIANINTLIEDSEGSRRAFLQEGLEKETAQRDEINKRIQAEEAAKLSLAQQEEAINAKKEAAQKRADALERISTAIAATATAIQAGLAVAKAAGQSGVAAPITVPLVVGAVAAGLGAILSIVSATRKFKDGGELDGPSHDEGGIKGTGSFGNIEVEGGEYIVNKQATRNNKDLLRKINMEGRWKKFENGGELKPNINQVNNLITSNSVTGGLSEIANQKVYLSLVEFKQANKKFTSIEEDNRI